MMKKLTSLLLVALLILSIAAPIAMAGVPTSVILMPDGEKTIYLRSGPGTKYAKRGVVTNGLEVDLLKIGSSWTQVRVIKTKATGYINNAYIKSLSETPTRGVAEAGVVGNCTSAYLHTGPSAEDARITALSSGTKLKCWGHRGGWHCVTTLSTGKTGWISGEYYVEHFNQKTTTKVHMRHSENGTLLKTLKKGTTVEVLSIDGSWSEVFYDGETGYIYTKYLK